MNQGNLWGLKIILVSLALMILTLPSLALASPGGTDALGCHVCRTNCAKYGLETGERHCHDKIAPQQQKVAIATIEPVVAKQKEDQMSLTPIIVLAAMLVAALALVVRNYLRSS
jgi:hypothetical protein